MRSFVSCKKKIEKPNYKAFFTKNAIVNLKNEFKNSIDICEVGGLLIGYHFSKLYVITDITSTGITKQASKVFCTLDGAEHTARAARVINGYIVKPNVLGVWHSHIFDGAVFSEQDRKSNYKISKVLGGAVSVLLTCSSKHPFKVDVSSYYVDTIGNTYHIKRFSV